MTAHKLSQLFKANEQPAAPAPAPAPAATPASARVARRGGGPGGGGGGAGGAAGSGLSLSARSPPLSARSPVTVKPTAASTARTAQARTSQKAARAATYGELRRTRTPSLTRKLAQL